MRAWVGVLLAGCISSHTALVGPYVTDLRNRGGVLEVSSCTIEVRTDHDFTFWWVTMFDGYLETTSRTIGANTCSAIEVPL
jgi:hypothetical protein